MVETAKDCLSFYHNKINFVNSHQPTTKFTTGVFWLKELKLNFLKL